MTLNQRVALRDGWNRHEGNLQSTFGPGSCSVFVNWYMLHISRNYWAIKLRLVCFKHYNIC